VTRLRQPELWVFIILLGSYAFFWHSRDWNTASRLMLTYALVDRGTLSIDGLDEQTGDKAWYRGHYYCDKLPGFSFLAAAPYAVGKAILGLPSHPLNADAFPYWWPDYWVTLAVSGVLSALTGAILAGLARDLGCGPRRAALVGLAYGLATPAYAYATLSYGHQASVFALLASFALLWRPSPPKAAARMVAAGFFAAYAAVIELQVGPVSAILGFYLLAQVLGGRRPVGAIGEFAVGAILPTLFLLGYNQFAFGSPFDLGYFHHATAMFHDVHSAKNPLGLNPPVWDHLGPLLWGSYRGLFFHAPILLGAIPGWLVLARRRPGMAIVTAAVCASVFLVNLSYPEWTGGWSTGPRLLVALLPFAMLPVAGLLAVGGRTATALAIIAALAGGVLMLLFQGVDARINEKAWLSNPLLEIVWPLWRGDPIPREWIGDRFSRNLVGLALPDAVKRLPDAWRWAQFTPLVAFQALAILGMCGCVRTRDDELGRKPMPSDQAASDSDSSSDRGTTVAEGAARPAC
jgi:hypothetical protein